MKLVEITSITNNCIGAAPVAKPPVGTDLPRTDYNDLDSSSFTIRQDTENGVSRSFGGELILKGATGRYVRWLLWECGALDNYIKFRIYDDCCNQTVFEGGASYLNSSVCTYRDGYKDDCTITLELEDVSEIGEQLRCFQSALVSNRSTVLDGARWDDRRFNIFPYCKQIVPKYYADAGVFGYALLAPILSIVLIIVTPFILFVTAIIAFANALGAGIGDIDFGDIINVLKNIYRIYDQVLVKLFTGCGKKLVAPYVRDLARNACAQCNLELQSSIIANPSSPWFNNVWIEQNSEPPGFDYYVNGTGAIKPEQREYYFAKNAPNLTGAGLMNRLNKMFFAQWRVYGGNLIFEQQGTGNLAVLDITNLVDAGRVVNICFDQLEDGEKPPRSYEIRFQDDPFDPIGGEARNRYDELGEWQPTNPSLQGHEINTIPFARQRFRNDGVTRDVISFWMKPGTGGWANFVPAVGTFNAIKAIWTALGVFKALASTDKDLLLSTGLTSIPRIIQANAFDTLEDVGANVDNGNAYNYKVYLYNSVNTVDNLDNLNGTQQDRPNRTPNLWEFWQRANPSGTVFKNQRVTIDIVNNCDTVRWLTASIKDYGLQFGLKFPYFSSIIETRVIEEINFGQNQISIKARI